MPEVHDREGVGTSVDARSGLVLAEPVFGPGRVSWHAMGFVAGAQQAEVTADERAEALGLALDAVRAEGVALSPGCHHELAGEGHDKSEVRRLRVALSQARTAITEVARDGFDSSRFQRASSAVAAIDHALDSGG